MLGYVVKYLIHRREVEPEVGQEGKGELKTGVEKEVEKISATDGSESSHVGIANILQWGKLKIGQVKMHVHKLWNMILFDKIIF